MENFCFKFVVPFSAIESDVRSDITVSPESVDVRGPPSFLFTLSEICPKVPSLRSVPAGDRFPQGGQNCG